MSSLFRKWSHLASASENMVSSSSCVLSRGGGGSPAFIESTWEGKPKIDWSPKRTMGPNIVENLLTRSQANPISGSQKFAS